MRDVIQLVSTAGTGYAYVTTKNKKTTTGKLEFSKYCRWCRKHTSHKETR